MIVLSVDLTYTVSMYNVYFQTFYEESSEGDEDSSNGRLFPQEQLASIIGDENIQHCPALIHLVLTDSVYTEERNSKDIEGMYYILSLV